MKIQLPKLFKNGKYKKKDWHLYLIIVILIVFVVSVLSSQNRISTLQNMISNLTQERDKNRQELDKIGKELEELKNQDQVKRNDELQNEIENIQTTYTKAIKVYENILEFGYKSNDTTVLEEQFSEALYKLSQKDYSGAEDTLDQIAQKIEQEEEKIAASVTIPASVPENNSPPGSGYSRQSVGVDGLGQYLVSVVAADLGSTKVIVDTASESDCNNDCPVLPLATYVSRNGAFAGINGTYFCPASYPSCAGKTNSFDLLVMNYKKTYFNSGNNVYSNNPAVIFGDGYIRFVSSVSQWGRDTSPNGVLSNYPLLVSGGNVVFGGDDDPKKGSKGGRSFVANKGNTVFIGVVHNATVAESARVLATMGMENALNLDDGGSTALWSGSYKVGPGRNLPNVILFVSK